MLDLLNKAETGTKLDTAGKRALIETELRADPSRSDREIARVVGNGIDHKTVGAARERMGIASPLGNSPVPEDTPTNRRKMLIAGAEDFNSRFPPGPAEAETAEQQVDEAIAAGKISLSPEVQGAVDQCHGAIMTMRAERQAKADQRGEECTLLPPRLETTIQHDEEQGRWIIRQRNWPDEDAEIWISDEDIHEFVDVLTDHLGYGRAP